MLCLSTCSWPIDGPFASHSKPAYNQVAIANENAQVAYRSRGGCQGPTPFANLELITLWSQQLPNEAYTHNDLIREFELLIAVPRVSQSHKHASLTPTLNHANSACEQTSILSTPLEQPSRNATNKHLSFVSSPCLVRAIGFAQVTRHG